jgi:hypothetical protein
MIEATESWGVGNMIAVVDVISVSRGQTGWIVGKV